MSLFALILAVAFLIMRKQGGNGQSQRMDQVVGYHPHPQREVVMIPMDWNPNGRLAYANAGFGNAGFGNLVGVGNVAGVGVGNAAGVGNPAVVAGNGQDAQNGNEAAQNGQNGQNGQR